MQRDAKKRKIAMNKIRYARMLARKNKTKRAVLMLFSEIKSYAFFIRLFEILLGVIIAAILSFMLARFLLLPVLYFIPIPVAYFVVRMIQSYYYDDIFGIEKKFRSFKEQLTTVRDNIHRENEMIEELEKDVISKSSRIKTEAFFRKRNFLIKALLIFGLMMVSSAVAPYNYTDIPKAVGPAIKNGYVPNGLPWFQKASSTGMQSPGKTPSTNNIFGNKTVLEQGTREIPIELQAARDSLDLNAVTDTQTNNFNGYAPQKIDVQGATYYQDTIPKSKYDVVKNYFNQKQ